MGILIMKSLQSLELVESYEPMVKLEVLNKIVYEMGNERAILRHLVDYALCLDEDLLKKFMKNWEKNPEVTKPVKAYIKREGL
jgi:hypothetical protein